LLVKEASPSDESLPFVSVVVPTFNERATIAQVIEALLAQTYPSHLCEIIVSDNGSNDGTPDIVKTYEVKLLCEPDRSSYRARNRAIEIAQGEYIAFTDGDCVAKPDWLMTLIERARSEACSLVGGRIENVVLRENFANQLLANRRSAAERRLSVERDQCLQGGNMLVARKLFQQLGRFSPVMRGGDMEFAHRAVAAGERVVYAEDAVVLHQCDLSNWDYLVRAFSVRFGQAANNTAKLSMRGYLRMICGVPWRPGLGAARETMARLNLSGSAMLCRLWLYLWLERMMAYWGGCVGTLCWAWRRLRGQHGQAGLGPMSGTQATGSST